jgi:NAD(P)-dependent dehydrogenase (short-subunit alcohol dehydrogenase family)
MSQHAAGVILVTGAASGIGRATAHLSVRRGYQVLAVDRDERGLDALRDEAGVVTLVADVTDGVGLATAVAATRDDRPALTAAVTCAGIEVIGDTLSLTEAEFRRSLDVNLVGTFTTVRAVLPELVESRGALVLVASDAGITGAQGYAAYCAAKHGVVGLMKAMALDLGPRGVRVNAVAPGFVETPMAERIFDGDRAAWEFYQGTVPLGRFARSDEVAKAILHLAGEDSSYVTGAVHSVDGGSTAGYFTPGGNHS